MSPLLLLSYIKYVDILNETRAAEDSIKREKYEKSEKGRDRLPVKRVEGVEVAAGQELGSRLMSVEK